MTVVSAIKNDPVKIIYGEEPLESMTKYLRKTSTGYDTRNYYKPDGVLTHKVEDYFNVSLLILETSSSYNKMSEFKRIFDHHKKTFALLSMLKRVVDRYSMCSFTTVSKLKVYFIHTFDDAMRLCSLRSPGPGIYLMRKKWEVSVPAYFSKREDELLFYIGRCWYLKLKVEEAANQVLEIQHKDQQRAREFRFKAFPKEQLLSGIVNPLTPLRE
jgi:hypothetical protein